MAGEIVYRAWYNEGMPQRKEQLSDEEESILTQAFVEDILEQARQTLKRDGALTPILFLRFQDRTGGILLLDLPETHGARAAHFAAIGQAFLAMGKILDEVLFLSETWYVMGDQNERLSLDVAPSQHPKRREAITILGRDAPRTRYTMVMQPFGRDRYNQPVFDEPAIGE